MLRTATDIPRQALLITGMYYLSFVLLGLSTSALGPTLPYLATNVGVTLQAISILFAARSFGYLLGAMFGARLYDYVAGHKLFAVVLVLLSISLAAIPFVSLLWLLTLLMLVLGALESTIDTGANTLLVWLHREKVGPFMNGLHFTFGIGAFLIPLIVALATASFGSPAWAYWLMAVLPLPLIIVFWRLPAPEPKQEASTATDSSAAPLGSYMPLVILIAVFLFFYAGVEIAFGNWIYSYALTTNLADEVSANYLTSAFWGAFTLGRLFTIPLALKLKPRQLLWLCQLGAAVSIIPMLVFPLNHTVIWLGSLGLGVSVAAIFPTIISFAERHMQIQGRIMGIFFVGVSLGSMAIPWFIGQLFESISPYVMVVIVAASLLFSILVLIGIMWRTKGR